MGQLREGNDAPRHEASSLSLATLKSGQILDWCAVDRAALIVLLPFPFMFGALWRVRLLMSDPALEPYMDRAWLGWMGSSILANIAFGLLFIPLWRWARVRAPESSAFVAVSLGLWLTALGNAAYLVGHVSTPIFGGLLAAICAILLFFGRTLSAPLVAYGFVSFFVPLIATAVGALPYGPVFREAPFATGHISYSWLTSTSVFAFGIAVVATAALSGVVNRWRTRDAMLLSLARLDPLTHVSNRRYFFDRLGVELERARRHGTKVAVLLLDLDHFKRVNDRFGHLTGDAVLMHVATQLVRDVLRRSDVIGRYGGEEFAVLLPETDTEGAMIVAERCRTAIATDPLMLGDQTRVRITASIGVAVPGEAFDADDLMQRVDEALYRAKANGRNRVVLANVTEPPRRSEPPVESLAAEG